LATLINDLSNLRIEHREPIKEFNARFNKLLNKIPTASKPSEQIRSEWYITALPANIAIFVDRAGKPTLAENMKEALAVEKRINALEKKAALEDRKAKKVSFKDYSKKKTPKDPYDMEGLQKVLKTLSNEMVEIKKHVAETSNKRPFRTYKKTESKPPNVITNADSEQEEEEEETTSRTDDEEEVAECHGMWDFILPNSDTDNEEEALPVTTRSKSTSEPIQATSKKRSVGAATTKEKVPPKKSPASVPQNQPSTSNSPSTSKTLVVSDSMEYNIVDDMKKTKANITMFELSKLKHQQKLLLKELNAVPSTPLPSAKAANDSGQPPSGMVEATDSVLIGDRSNSHTPPFLLTYEIYNRNLHNCLIDSGASSNIMPASVCSKLNIEPQKSAIHIVQLDRTKVQVVGEINSVTIRLSADPRVVQRIDILIADIPEFYGLILSRDWSEKLHGYISTDWSHMWLPYKGKPNQIRIDREKHMTHTVTEFEQENQPVAFNNNILGNYSSESFFGNFVAQPSPFSVNHVSSQIENFSQTDRSRCFNDDEKTVNMFVNTPLFWSLYFDGSKSSEGSGAGCILVSPEGEKTMLSCRLEFECTNNTAEYEALVQGLYKAIGLKVQNLKVFGDSEIIVKQVRNTIHCLSNHLKHYQSLVQDLISQFSAFNISSIPRSQNSAADLLANVASKLLPSEDYSPDRFSVELLFRPSIPDNITNWRVFNHDEDILQFLTSEKSYDNQIIEENEHDLQMKAKTEENSIPKPVVKLEDLCDIKDRFKPVTNAKLHSSTLRFELINLGTEQTPQNINLGLGLSLEEKEAFIKLLRKNKQVFAWKYDDLKTYDTSIIQHTIPMLPDQKPIQQKLRKIHPNLESQIKTELNKLLKAKIIFPVRHSNWASNMVPVRKKNGDIRICIDFRNLNKASLKDNFPFPTMEQILQSVAGSELMSFLDGFSGYNQVLVHPDDQLKTTFRTKWGTYAYQKMPFGLINAEATFQRAMDTAFKGLINRTVVIYLDDITVFSKERSSHLQDLNQIFQRCKRYGISLNPKKSFFSLDQGKLLGFIVSKEGIYIDPDRIKEISEIPFPHNKKSMQSFLGQINFVKRFVPDFSQIILPLQAMIKKNSVFKWGSAEKEAFELIKQSIINAPALNTPNFSNHFTLYTIASNSSYAAVLTQLNNHNLEAPISFFSSNLQGAELNYSEV